MMIVPGIFGHLTTKNNLKKLLKYNYLKDFKIKIKL